MECRVCGKGYERKQYFRNGKPNGYGPIHETCSRVCGQRLRFGDPAILFWSHVDTSGGPDACHPWTASRVKGGYGRVGWEGRLQLAHRVAYKLANPDFDESLDVLHTCDNPPCCNLAHLFQGDHQENMDDMVAKGRSPDKRGRLNGRAILTEEKVLEIIRLSLEGASQRDLASQFGVSQQTISQIIRGERWGHLTRTIGARA